MMGKITLKLDRCLRCSQVILHVLQTNIHRCGRTDRSVHVDITRVLLSFFCPKKNRHLSAVTYGAETWQG